MYATAFKVLEILEKSDKPVPSSEISTSLSISGSAVWKHINELRMIGYDIVASDDDGYLLEKSGMEFRPHVIYKHLKTKVIGRR
ncbi:MAG: HTH domain-containing protein, partial [Methanospirillum sp.]|uniref:HTH domain-containing protein n=1 Tax=Methanospirillum sp. TaxID=45200 RepID=UPI00236AB207